MVTVTDTKCGTSSTILPEGLTGPVVAVMNRHNGNHLGYSDFERASREAFILGVNQYSSRAVIVKLLKSGNRVVAGDYIYKPVYLYEFARKSNARKTETGGGEGDDSQIYKLRAR